MLVMKVTQKRINKGKEVRLSREHRYLVFFFG